MSNHADDDEACRYVLYKAYPQSERLVILQNGITRSEAEDACVAFLKRSLGNADRCARPRDVYELRYTSMRAWRLAYGALRTVQGRRLPPEQSP